MLIDNKRVKAQKNESGERWDLMNEIVAGIELGIMLGAHN